MTSTGRHSAIDDVPADIRRTEGFRHWLSTLDLVGNELRFAKQEWTVRSGPNGDWLFYWALRVQVFVAAENRLKEPEVVICRPDVSAVLAYRRDRRLLDSEVVLVREFRAAGATSDGFIHELPSGAGEPGLTSPQAVAAREFAEETGLVIDPNRLRRHHSRQPVAKTLLHRMHLFSVELTASEIGALRTDQREHGDHSNGEITYVEITRLADLLADDRTDWSTLGAVTEVLLKDHAT